MVCIATSRRSVQMRLENTCCGQSSTVTVVATRPATFSPRNGGEAARCTWAQFHRPPSAVGHYGLGEIASSVRKSPQWLPPTRALSGSRAVAGVRTRRLRVEGPRAASDLCTWATHRLLEPPVWGKAIAKNVPGGQPAVGTTRRRTDTWPGKGGAVGGIFSLSRLQMEQYHYATYDRQPSESSHRQQRLGLGLGLGLVFPRPPRPENDTCQRFRFCGRFHFRFFITFLLCTVHM